MYKKQTVMIPKFPFHRQLGELYCGLTCIKMISDHLWYFILVTLIFYLLSKMVFHSMILVMWQLKLV